MAILGGTDKLECSGLTGWPLINSKGKPMQLRHLSLLLRALLGATILLFSSYGLALGLGEVTIKSSYNEPLNAEISLLQVQNLSREEILVTLASEEDFERIGLERSFFLTSLKFEVVTDASPAFIRVTSPKPIDEPYLNFLVDTQWPGGRLLREYTLLLDLPAFTTDQFAKPITPPAVETVPQQVPPVTQPAVPESIVSEPVISESVEPVLRRRGPPRRLGDEVPNTVERQPQPVENTEEFERVENASASVTPEDTQSIKGSHRVQAGDTLWKIASELRPDSSVSVQQTMLAIQAANPDAFIAGNINLLRKGKVLRAPTLGEIRDISRRQALASVKQQNKAWSERSQKPEQKPTLSAAPKPSTADSVSSATPEGRLTLGVADKPDSGSAVSGGTSNNSESLQNELAIAQEELDKASRETSQLRSRIAELEAQIETMESLFQLTNDQLKAIELAKAQAQKTASSPETGLSQNVIDRESLESVVNNTVDTEEASSTVPEVEPDTATNLPQPREITPRDNLVDENTVVTESRPKPVVVEEPIFEEKTSFIGSIIQFITGGSLIALSLVLLVVIALLLSLWLLIRPRRADEEEELNYEAAEEEESPSNDDIGLAAAVEEESEDFTVEEEAQNAVEAKTEDAVAEADIYSSLGQYEKAEELLQQEIQKKPDNADARVALLKIYAQTQNVNAFDDQYAQLLPLDNGRANEQARMLRESIHGVSDFNVGSESTNGASEISDDGTEADDSESLALPEEPIDDLELPEDDLELSEDDLELSESPVDDLELPEDPIDNEMREDSEKAELSEASVENEENLLEDDELELVLDVDEFLPPNTDKDAFLEIEDSLIDELDADDSEDEALQSASTEAVNDSLVDDGVDDIATEESTAELDDLSFDEELLADLPKDEPPSHPDIMESDEWSELELDVDEGLLSELSQGASQDLGEQGLEPVADSDSLEESTTEEVPEDNNEFDLDVPPEDLDIESLDKEIDELTLALDNVSVNSRPVISGPSAVAEPSVKPDDTPKLRVAPEPSAIPEVSVGDGAAPPALSDEDGLDDEDLDFFESTDEVATKLDLARAYIDMGDHDGAEDILQEVSEEGSSEQKEEAQSLLASM